MIFSIADNIQNVRKRIQKAREKSKFLDEVQLLAVTKTCAADELQQAMLSGVVHFGENYLSEALKKQNELEVLCDQILSQQELCLQKQDCQKPGSQKQRLFKQLTWHFIGPIQSNKTKLIAEHFDWVHSVDRLKVAQRLNDQRSDGIAPLNVCIQVNIDEEESKSGVTLRDVDALALSVSLMPNLKLRGLMCIPNATLDETLLRQSFLKMKTHFDLMKARYSQMDTLSMGMSGDFEIAIDCGSTLVRVGTALFGKRSS